MDKGVDNLLNGRPSWEDVCRVFKPSKSAIQGEFSIVCHVNVAVHVWHQKLQLEVTHEFEERISLY